MVLRSSKRYCPAHSVRRSRADFHNLYRFCRIDRSFGTIWELLRSTWGQFIRRATQICRTQHLYCPTGVTTSASSTSSGHLKLYAEGRIQMGRRREEARAVPIWRFLADIGTSTRLRGNLPRMQFVSGCILGLLLINLCKDLPYIGNQ
jgi:hypothetical protein